jgi:protein translocase SecG subunit
MTLLIGFLTFILVMNCLFLMLLVLIQLPKKEAGAGIAFGGAATDALFGAGSGNALTKMTKYSATLFVGLAILLSMLNMQAARRGKLLLKQELSRQASMPAPIPAATSNMLSRTTPAATNAEAPLTITPSAITNNLLITTPTNAAITTTPPATAPAPAPANTQTPTTPVPAPATTPAK